MGFCMNWGHTMAYCHKIKDCKLCGVYGHNPLRCWRYCTIREWMERAEELGRCGECLALLPAEGKRCTKCCTKKVYWKPQEGNNIGCQTKEDGDTIRECKSELQKREIIIEDLKNKLSKLKRKLESSNTVINELNWKWTDALKEREQEELKSSKLDALYKNKEMELKSLQEQLFQRDDELEHHRRRGAQPSPNAPGLIQQHIPAALSNCTNVTQQYDPAVMQQYCSAALSNNPISVQQHNPAATQQNYYYPALKFKNSAICNCINPTLISLQDQQQKLCVIINNLYDRIMTHNASWMYYPNFNPKEEPYDTGQKF